MLAIAVSYGLARYGYGLFVPVFREEFGLGTSQIGLLASGSYAGYLAALTSTGVMTARVGPRRPVVIGAASAAAGTALVGVAWQPWVFALGVLLAGSAAGWSWAPYSDAVVRELPPASRPRVLAAVSTGTTFGLLIAAPVAAVGGAAWRAVWVTFAAIALMALVYNAWLLPTGPASTRDLPAISVSVRWLVNRRSASLFAVTLFQSLAGAVYWTYAVDLIHRAGLPAGSGPLLWAAVGLAGIAGLAAGDLTRHVGLDRTLLGSTALLATGVVILGARPGAPLAVALSGLTFGAGFMLTAGVLVIWSSEVFPQRPSAGFSATMTTMAVGSVLGPGAVGAVAGHTGLATAIFGTGLLTATAALIPIARLARQRAAAVAPRGTLPAASTGETPQGHRTTLGTDARGRQQQREYSGDGDGGDHERVAAHAPRRRRRSR